MNGSCVVSVIEVQKNACECGITAFIGSFAYIRRGTASKIKEYSASDLRSFGISYLSEMNL
jgi:hypothetical protein